jgi:hypothetical protein
MKRYLLIACVTFITACGPTGQVRVAQHLECSTDGTNCQTIQTAQYEPTATDRFWQIFLLLLLR